MSEKRYVCREDSRGDIYIHDGSEGFNFDIEKACEVLNRQNDLLSRQAETIEVLREWLRDPNVEMRILVDNAYYWASQDEKEEHWDNKQKALIVESKRRIAALEGK